MNSVLQHTAPADSGLQVEPLAVTITTSRPVSVAGPTGWQAVVKRGLDIAVALTVILAVLPLLLVLALAVKLTSPGPVLFRQARVGRHGQTFDILKLRTFPVGHVPPPVATCDGDTAIVPVSASPLRVGRILRRTSLDELPQLFNILLGHMSLVGPRPERPELVADLSHRIPGYLERHRAPVGLTGSAQVLGYCGSTPIEERVAADNEYIDNWSLRRDLAIIVRTVPSLFRKFQTHDLID
jgi:lipopolysaccharide/colanic/teichoic acid biosynthesis glycosyltransferase